MQPQLNGTQPPLIINLLFLQNDCPERSLSLTCRHTILDMCTWSSHYTVMCLCILLQPARVKSVHGHNAVLNSRGRLQPCGVLSCLRILWICQLPPVFVFKLSCSCIVGSKHLVKCLTAINVVMEDLNDKLEYYFWLKIHAFGLVSCHWSFHTNLSSYFKSFSVFCPFSIL